MDINPAACPNLLNLNGSGVFGVALLGSAELDVADIDLASVRLEGVASVHHTTRDVGQVDYDPCGCASGGPDGTGDVVLQFDREAILRAIEPVVRGESVSLSLSGTLLNGTPFHGSDCVTVILRGSGMRGPRS